ncbi:squalene synthase isoform X1 [Patella vulgata]|uniref:squalene synthase isoform X1 n=2 Tax=Patella vulgata TaxID=6465 RepID=UPI0021800B72|nr:squalene synthase isoform X1 [Patella vulgata]XP_050389698.1 squalene synthase isoform X1 [Patella vulgata]XP_055954304.1 squalene synthase isoform X1 [Patella vulgata]
MEFVKSFAHPDEVMALVKFKMGGCQAVMPKCDTKTMSETLKKCYVHLTNTSRSFAAVIQAIDDVALRHATCIFYLVLRALDTVEDDMTIPNSIKIPMLKSFYKNLQDKNWKYMDSKEKDKLVLEDFPTISYEFRQLEPVYQQVISDICKQMGAGMTVFFERDLITLAEWDEYCHYVAGLVGIGLSKLFSASKQEDDIVGKDTYLSNRMGLFLQKTNIIRDYLEDQLEGRAFWPRAVWGKYASELGDLAKEENVDKSVQCLNELITNALELIPDCIKYMSRLKDQSVFNFCAIPQVMAIGTLERCYNNSKVFKGVVKIRKGEAVKMMMGSTNLEQVKAIMSHFTSEILRRIPANDPTANRTREVCQQALNVCQTKHEYTTSSIFPPLYMSCVLMIGAISYKYWSEISSVYDSFVDSYTT